VCVGEGAGDERAERLADAPEERQLLILEPEAAIGRERETARGSAPRTI
jgi:hypothetical protein